MSRLPSVRKSSAKAKARALEKLRAAVAAHERGDFASAETGYRAVLALASRQVHALQLLGALLVQTARFEEGLSRLDEAIALDPNLPDAHIARGGALSHLRRLDEALEAYNTAAKLRPDHAETWKLGGVTYAALQRYAEAIAVYDHALELKPGWLEVIGLRGLALGELRRFDEGLKSVDEALAIDPDFPNAWTVRGVLLFNNDRIADALEAFDRGIALAPAVIDNHINRGAALGRLERLDEAARAFETALTLHPESGEAMFQRAALALARGDMESGWRDYEHRFTSRQLPRRLLKQTRPVWRGEPLEGRSILVDEEQGNGDIIQFGRYLPLLAARGADVTFVVRESLIPLMRTLPGRLRIVSEVEDVERFDYQCALLSLPLGFGTQVETIPGDTPYLSADPQRVAFWRKRMGAGGLKVGISWAASVQGWRQGRSASLADFAGLSRLPEVRLISLQKEFGAEQLLEPPAGMEVETLGPDYEKGDWLETAAVISALDLVVSIDTAILHVAGALARPVWIALPHVADWRWLRERGDSPWYPTARLFRQRAKGSWRSAFAAMETALRAMSREAA